MFRSNHAFQQTVFGGHLDENEKQENLACQLIICKIMSSYMCCKKCRQDINRTQSCSLSRRAVKRRLLARQSTSSFEGGGESTNKRNSFWDHKFTQCMQIVYFHALFYSCLNCSFYLNVNCSQFIRDLLKRMYWVTNTGDRGVVL